MLVVERNTTFVQWGIGDDVHPLEYAGDVVIAFDPSKSNMAMIVGTPDGTILNVLEFSGNNRKRGPVMDNTVYCNEVRAFLKAYLCHCNLYCVGIEQAIMKKGQNYYHSQMTLTEIRGNMLNLFLEEFNIHVIEVNNWSWKSAILPEGYRGMYQKGSKKYFHDTMPGSPYNDYFEADVTDCICIYWYLCKNRCASYALYCNRIEKSLSGFEYTLVANDSGICDELQEVTFNPKFSLEDNLVYYSNRILNTFYMVVSSDIIPIEDVYNRCLAFTFKNVDDSQVKVVARRK